MASRRLWASLVGVLSALVSLAVAEAIAAFLVLPASSPLFAVGSFVIDIVPGWFKTAVIALFGTNDKVVLLVALGVLVLVLAAAVGILQYRRPPWGVVGLVAVGAFATLAASTRADASGFWAIPTLVGTVAGVFVLRAATERLRVWTESAPRTATKRDLARAGLTRRRFFIMLGGTAAGALVVGLGARVINAGTAAVNSVREALTLPKPATAAPPIPAGADLGIPGISPLISANDTFYRIDTALQVPVIDASAWSLKITGMVENEVQLSFAELLALPMTEHTVTLMCVSNEVGGNLVGNATWLGYPIRELLKKAKPQAGADMVLSRSYDGFTASTPLEILLEEDRESLLAVGMNGKPLPLEHGFPVRMVVPGLYGYVSATKWVVELQVTRFADHTAYWTDRGWSDHGPVKTSSRIDVPSSGSRVDAGTVAVAGVAWAQHTGIDRVEVRVDGGSWQPARLADPISIDTWRQWVYEWDAASGNHTIEVRATDAAGMTQSGTPVPVAPNGSEGWHTVTVSVA
ncbi:MAG: oxidoreductase [Rhodoglobus sp.]|nr:oxidoreductase [Rhodoglobus sp.]